MTRLQVIETLVRELRDQVVEIERREAEVARAAEALSQQDAVQQALRCGRQEERGRVVALIDLQLEQLDGAGLNAMSLRTLRRQLLEGG
jgi:hypothetical protein